MTRIFVNPAIKQRLCLDAGADRAWLHKVRPWFGHRAHMHVRLRCPAGSLECQEQDTPPPGDGCGAELASWFVPHQPNAAGQIRAAAVTADLSGIAGSPFLSGITHGLVCHWPRDARGVVCGSAAGGVYRLHRRRRWVADGTGPAGGGVPRRRRWPPTNCSRSAAPSPPACTLFVGAR